jgi:hypothetical protein
MQYFVMWPTVLYEVDTGIVVKVQVHDSWSIAKACLNNYKIVNILVFACQVKYASGITINSYVPFTMWKEIANVLSYIDTAIYKVAILTQLPYNMDWNTKYWFVWNMMLSL